MKKEEIEWVFNRNSDAKGLIRQLKQGITARIFVGNQSMLSYVRLAPNSQGSIHQHPEEQWGILLEGSCIRIQENQEVEMQVGDFWYTPSNVLHGIRTTNQPAVILDVFSPPRPEYRTKGEGFGANETK